MLSPDSLIFLAKYFVLFIYGAALIISIIFTFFINTFNRLNEILNVSFVSTKTLNPLESNVDFLNEWLIARNKVIGPILILLSLLDMVILLRALSHL